MEHIKTIAIISALQEELDYLFDKKDLEWGPLYDLDNKLHVRECVVNDHRIVAAHASDNMGLTELAILATRIILICKPVFLAMLGICGGLKKKEVNIGDVIVADKSFHYQFGSFKDGCVQRELKICNVDHGYFAKIMSFLNRRMMSEIQNSSPRGMNKSEKILRVHSGPMASADLVVKDEIKLNEAKMAERKVIAVDMESYAVLRAANLLGARAIIVKSVSDFADYQKGEDDDLREYAKYNATEALYQFIINEFSLITFAIKMQRKDVPHTFPQGPRASSTPNEVSILINPLLTEIQKGMVLIPAADFTMGDTKVGQRVIKISRPYLMSRFPITQSLYWEIMDKNPSHFKGENLPVENVTWFDAIDFCNELSKRSGLHHVYDRKGEDVIINYDQNGFRLPTEAEWEHAACPEDFDESRKAQYAWYMSNSKMSPHEVGQKDANSFGLHDMLGNVWEWCNDWYCPYEKTSDSMNTTRPDNCEKKVRRGGSWSSFSNNIHPKYRDSSSPDTLDNHIGFRMVRNIPNL